MLSTSRKPLPWTRAPDFDAATVGGGRWSLTSGTGNGMTLLIFYRGGFCSYCRDNLQDFEAHAAAFRERAVELVFASADDARQAQLAAERWGIVQTRICYGAGVGLLEDWGLYLSAGERAMRQPEVFAEPGLFLVRGDMTLAFAALNSGPFGRPRAADMLGMLDFMASKGSAFPRRGGWDARNMWPQQQQQQQPGGGRRSRP